MQDNVPQNDHILNKIVLSENTDDYLIPDNSVLLLVLTVHYTIRSTGNITMGHSRCCGAFF
jgi:hypothetical protein